MGWQNEDKTSTSYPGHQLQIEIWSYQKFVKWRRNKCAYKKNKKLQFRPEYWWLKGEKQPQLWLGLLYISQLKLYTHLSGYECATYMEHK